MFTLSLPPGESKQVRIMHARGTKGSLWKIKKSSRAVSLPKPANVKWHRK